MTSWLRPVLRRVDHLAAAWRLAWSVVQDRRFWLAQLAVVLVAAADTAMDSLLPQRHGLSFLAVTLFFAPVTYTALHFGFFGATATALWCVVLDVPIILLRHHGAVQGEELLQLFTVGAVAVFVARRIDREAAARGDAEAARTALRVSEARYRGLFEASPMPVLLLGAGGEVREANSAAAAFLGLPPGSAAQPVLADLLGAAAAQSVLDGIRWPGQGTEELAVCRADGRNTWVQPLISRIPPDERGDLYQVLLRDMTEERHRQEDLRSYARGVLHAQEDERKRLSQEIHDETIQDMVALSRQLDTLAHRPPEASPQELAASLEEARAFTEEIMQALRRFARALRPPVLDHLGLSASLRQLLGEMEQRTGTVGRFQVQGAVRRLPPEMELGLFRIAQEALRNVERHARATLVSVRLCVQEADVRLAVRDNGVGFQAAGVRPAYDGSHLGLTGMRERAELLGGALQVRSAPGRGTSVRVCVPVLQGRRSGGDGAAHR